MWQTYDGIGVRRVYRAAMVHWYCIAGGKKSQYVVKCRGRGGGKVPGGHTVATLWQQYGTFWQLYVTFRQLVATLQALLLTHYMPDGSKTFNTKLKIQS